MVRNLSFIFTSLLLQVSNFYFIEGIHLLEEIFIIILSPDFHANPLFLSVFFPRQLFDNHSFMGIPVIRSLSKVARGYLPTNTDAGLSRRTRQASSMASAALTTLF